jgi:protein gp37
MPYDYGFGELTVHPVADLFPMMDAIALEALAEDIKEHGLRNPVVLTWDRKTIVDGRNRLAACDKAEVDPRFIDLDASYTEQEIRDYIVSLNIERRHLSESQRAMIAVDLANMKRGGDGSNQHESKSVDLPNSLSQAEAAEKLNVSVSSVGHARLVRESGDAELVEAVKSGEVAVSAAAKLVRAKKKREEPPPKEKKGPKMLSLKTHLGEDVLYPAPKSKATFNATNDQVSWAAWTWNPVTGCLHGCRYCYAREMAEMRDSYKPFYPAGFTPLFHPERLDAPANTPLPDLLADPRMKRCFVCSMADLYGKWVPREWIDQVHEACIANPQWEYLMLTKFPKRYLEAKLPKTAWLGTSVDEQKRVRLAEEAFREIEGVRVKWLSLEPLLAPLKFTDLSMFDWIVIGSQSATNQPDGRVAEFAPPFEWVARLVDQAREAGCRVYLKPNLLGAVGPQSAGMDLPQEEPILKPYTITAAAE